MRGKVLAYNDADGHGVISGDDGQRYAFVRGSLVDARIATPGQDADFRIEGDQAMSIYLTGGQPAQAVSAYAAPAGGYAADGTFVETKSKVVAALLAFFLGSLGIHKFYLNKTGPGVTMLLCGTIGWLLILPPLVIGLIAFIEFIIYLTKSDAEFHRDYVIGDKGWF